MELSKVAFPRDRQGLLTWKNQDPWVTAYGVLIFPPRPKGQGQHLMVLKGSEIQVATVDSCPANAYKMRKYIEREKMIDEVDNIKGVLKRDIIFSAPSTASNVVLGISSNGWDRWEHQFGPTKYSLNQFIERKEKDSSPVPLTMSYYEAPAEAFDINRINWKDYQL